MARINSHYQKLAAGYLFPEIGRRVKAFAEANPGAEIIRLGIGDVTRPLAPAIVEAFHRGVDDMASAASFKGYGPDRGYDFLLEAIAEHDFRARGADVSPEEIFLSDGAKCDSGNIQEIFSTDCVVAVADPVYPVYVDTNVMAGRTGEVSSAGHYGGIVYMPCLEENGFLPDPPAEPADLIYLCSPNNPTGTVARKAELARWVAHARETGAVILYDAAYEAFITEDDVPHSIYEVEGAREVAIEFRSFSKTAGFTGTRCAYTVVPRALTGTNDRGEEVSVHAHWSRRQATKFNGVSYPVQVAASAVYTPEGRAQVEETIAYYLENARIIREGVAGAGLRAFGGVNAPYIWLRCPEGTTSWDFFDRLLERAHVVGTPGSGFGPAGEGYFRLSAFGDRADVEEAVARIRREL